MLKVQGEEEEEEKRRMGREGEGVQDGGSNVLAGVTEDAVDPQF